MTKKKTTRKPGRPKKTTTKRKAPQKYAMKSYAVWVPQPMSVTDEEMREYIEGAISEMKGCLHPDDPIFSLVASKIEVFKG